ncbi:hypothetical protein CVT26_015244 [Gymnopilus dilepis]|uniref:F-box domain-containing protein n=1 Tax=Gymnopilus dilepis TaxID=231916 RepID=A0A409W9Z6_9AGAR|nr:hypothetical protein CVT26_015244 [Gymnopilus dilepis]
MALLMDVPVEILFYLGGFLPRSAIIALLRTCRHFLLVFAVDLYSNVEVSGVQGRKLALSVLTSRHVDYAGLIKRLFFHGVDSTDHLYLTYPLIVDAISIMNRVEKLTLVIPGGHASYFYSLMDRQGLLRLTKPPLAMALQALTDNPPSSRYNLPRLSELEVDGDHRLARLTMNRRINHLTIRELMTLGTLSEVTSWMPGEYLHTLNIQLIISTTMELLLGLYGVSDCCPNLHRFEAETGMFNALEITEAFSTFPVLFPNLRDFWLNRHHFLPPVFGTPAHECFVLQQRHLSKATEHLRFLTSLRFGLVDWTGHDGGTGRKWRSEYFRKEITVGPQWEGYSGEYSCLFLKE